MLRAASLLPSLVRATPKPLPALSRFLHVSPKCSTNVDEGAPRIAVYESPPNPFSKLLKMNPREVKPRRTGLTEIRGPYYSVMGTRYLQDIFDTMDGGEYIDSLKFAGGSFSIMPEKVVRDIIDLCHKHKVKVSTGGFIERVLATGGPVGDDLVERYLKACKSYGFDIVELSAGFISLPTTDWLHLIRKTKALGLTPKPELGILFGAGGGVSQGRTQSLQAVEQLLSRAKRFIDEGCPILMIESEGITENVPQEMWRTDVISRIIDEIGIENVMFEAAEPEVFTWFIKNYGADVNLFVDHSQIVQLECLRQGVWGTADTWGRIVNYRV